MKKTLFLLAALMFSGFFGLNLHAEGDVFVEVDDGELIVEGQNNTEQAIAIEATNVFGQYRFVSVDQETTYNGQTQLLVSGVSGDISIDLGSGLKLLIMTEAQADSFFVPGDLEIKNKGNFSAIMLLDEVVVAGSVDVKTKNGEDVLFMTGNSASDRTKINLGNGNDGVFIGFDSEFSEKLEIKTGGGDDYAIVFETTVFGNLDLKTGGQNDTIGVYSSLAGVTSVNGNGGADAFEEDSEFVTLKLKSIEADFVGGLPTMFAEARANNASFDDAVVLFTFFNLGN